MAGLGVLGRAERQRVETGNRPRAHGEDVAQNAADASRRALIGLDVARVIVAFHLEDAGQPIANVDDAGVLTRALDDVRTGGRQAAQMNLGRLVGAVLVPHRRENAEFGQRRFAPDQLKQALIFVRFEAVFGDQFGSDFWFGDGH